jgi:hypothetical protein
VGQPAEAVTIGGVDHTFSVFDPTTQHAARLKEITLAWYLRTL